MPIYTIGFYFLNWNWFSYRMSWIIKFGLNTMGTNNIDVNARIYPVCDQVYSIVRRSFPAGYRNTCLGHGSHHIKWVALCVLSYLQIFRQL